MHIVNSNEWNNILNWEHEPNFQTCHRHKNINDFKKEYFKSFEVDNLIKNSLKFIKVNGSSNAKLTGKMGSGKTTFLHYLRKIIASDFHLSTKVFFYIIRAGNISPLEYHENLREIIITRAFKQFFEDANYKEQYDIIMLDENITDQEKLLKLTTFYQNKENNFSKRLILVLDDLDTINNESDVINILNSFKRICGSGDSMSKWVSLRDTTIDNYSYATLQELTYFVQPLILPKVSLYDIVQQKIIAKNGTDAINPFSKNLCDKILKLKNGSIRDAMGILNGFLHYTKPPKQKQSESIIQNWFEKSALTVLLKLKEIPNIHTEKFVTIFNYPVAYDLLQIIRYSHIQEHVTSIAVYIAEQIRGQKFNGNFSLIENQLKTNLKILEQNKLIICFEDGIYKQYRLSFSGKLIVQFDQKNYATTCKQLAEDDLEDLDDDYWSTLDKIVLYKKLSEDKNISRRI